MPKLIKKLLEPNTLLVICLLYVLLITIAFLFPARGSVKVNFIIPLDKIVHSSIYLILAFLWNIYFYLTKNKDNIKKSVFAILGLCLAYGIIIEIIQEQFVQFRGADIFDVLANMIGAMVGTIIFLNVKNRIKS
ncbi:MAG: VanZ family protein [Flavobacteriaceae bacterium]|nr:VanZ family protein [Flavobacteriaceae bacterium]